MYFFPKNFSLTPTIRYLDNICKNPDEEKFQKIKKSNKVFQVR